MAAYATETYSRLGFERVMEADDPSAILGGIGRSWLIERVSERQDGSVSLRALLRTNVGVDADFQGRQREVV
ncbi:hypothetical protein K504DRAFT_509036 [Pleomassaria siparia CBS 279.74]|uniref:Uncharacterized protein n=1 Tax=Pleomassaria siparia CBS 279.74 TaxID=1314801 RepID=A0A6G1JPD6_9PLEO|nr:hypothetical protein K504DRAFT_509036 [Pleomassaria siparia CBS 279.74]